MILLEKTILRQLLSSQTYAEQVIPYLKEEYFLDEVTGKVYSTFQSFFEKYRTLPSFAAMRLDIDSITTFSEKQAKTAAEFLTEIEQTAPQDDSQHAYLLEQTEKFCQERALHCALRKSISLLDDKQQTPHAIPDLLKEALAVSFDTHIGHDLFGDAENRYNFYHKAESRIPFDLEVFNSLTKGGIPTKTLNIVLAGTNVGKSLFLTHMAAACVRMSKNVLYITLEMAEERIAERVDANLMDIPIDDVIVLPKERYLKKIDHLRQTSTGRLLIKEYPTASAHAGHFRALLHELKLKQQFTPDILMIDYLSICASARIKMGNAINSYTYNKFIAEELRGLAVEFNIPIFTAAQFNREGFKSSDPGLQNVGESFGIPQTADFMFALTTTEELEKNGQIQAYVLKNRYGKRNSFQKFILGIDTSRMKLYETTETTVIATSAPNAATDSYEGWPGRLKPSFGGRRTPKKPLDHLKTDSD